MGCRRIKEIAEPYITAPESGKAELQHIHQIAQIASSSIKPIAYLHMHKVLLNIMKDTAIAYHPEYQIIVLKK